VAINDALPV